jgi:hypothetical protein
MTGWDLGSALVLGVVLHGFVDWVKRLPIVPNLGPSVLQLLVWASGIGSVFLVSATVWAHQNVLGGVPLDRMNGWSKVAAGLIVGGIATGIDRLSFYASRTPDPNAKVVKVGAAGGPPADLAQHP